MGRVIPVECPPRVRGADVQFGKGPSASAVDSRLPFGGLECPAKAGRPVGRGRCVAKGPSALAVDLRVPFGGLECPAEAGRPWGEAVAWQKDRRL